MRNIRQLILKIIAILMLVFNKWTYRILRRQKQLACGQISKGGRSSACWFDRSGRQVEIAHMRG
jgi:hypothetical protein